MGKERGGIRGTTQAGGHSDGGGDAHRFFIKAILVISTPEFCSGGVRTFFGFIIVCFFQRFPRDSALT